MSTEDPWRRHMNPELRDYATAVAAEVTARRGRKEAEAEAKARKEAARRAADAEDDAKRARYLAARALVDPGAPERPNLDYIENCQRMNEVIALADARVAEFALKAQEF